MRKYVCGVNPSECSGAVLQTSAGLRGKIVKAHGSPLEAFRCKRRDLLRQGYKEVGMREFSPPDGGPILVLTKKSRFGAALRGGKRGGGLASETSRVMPLKRTGGGVFPV